MPDTTPIKDQKQPAAPTPVASQPPAPEPEPEEEEIEEEGEEEGEEEEEEMLRTEFMNLKDSLDMGMKQLKNIPHLSPQALRNFLVMDLYPILMEITDFANWYIGDLHRRVMTIESEMEGESDVEALSPEFAEQLLNFIGMSLQIFAVILRSPKADPNLLHTAQLLTAQAPGLLARIQEITMSDEPEEEDEEYEDEYEASEQDEEEDEGEPAVLEPTKQGAKKPAQVVPPAPAPQAAEAPASAPVEEAATEPKESSDVSPAEVTPVAEASAPEEPRAEAAQAPEQPPAEEEKTDG